MLPRSDMFPMLAKDFLDTLELSLKQEGGQNIVPEFYIESIGNAAGNKVAQFAEKMLVQNNPDLVVAFCGHANLNELICVFNAYKKPLIHADLGGNVLTNDNAGDYVIHHTLNLWQSAYIAGQYGAGQLGKKAALAVSFYDGGYHHAESFVKGFTENGGKIVNSYVSPMDYKSETFEKMIAGIKAASPDFVFALFSYKEAAKVFEVFARSGLSGKIPILAGPLMVDETAPFTHPQIENVFSVSSWAFGRQADTALDFQKIYSEQFKKQPTVLSLLAYEVGLTIAKLTGTNESFPTEIGGISNELKIISPRGNLMFSKLNESFVKSNFIKQFGGHGEQHVNTTIGDPVFFELETLYEKFEALPHSGWLNPFAIT